MTKKLLLRIQRFSLTSVSVGGLVKHEHGIINLEDTEFYTHHLTQCTHAPYCLTSPLLKFSREAQQQMDKRGRKRRGGGGGQVSKEGGEHSRGREENRRNILRGDISDAWAQDGR